MQFCRCNNRLHTETHLYVDMYTNATPDRGINIEKHLSIFDGWLCYQHAFSTLTLQHTHTHTPDTHTHTSTHSQTVISIIFMIYVCNCRMAPIVAYLAIAIPIYCFRLSVRRTAPLTFISPKFLPPLSSLFSKASEAVNN